ncbi:MAG: ATP-dependent protease subunit HslV [Candidatus Eisenbacteria bacterium]|jgi:ATP-dependent HslUV protease subunit HslV
MRVRSTTIIGVRKNGRVAMGGDGQVSLGETVMKEHARKIRKIHNDTIITGFAGASADALALFEKFESRIDQYKGNLTRAVVELAKEWRTDKMLRRLEALLAVMDKEHSFIVAGTGEIIEPDDGIVAIGSGGGYAMAAARALVKYSNLEASAIVEESLKIASHICVYTNDNITVEVLD